MDSDSPLAKLVAQNVGQGCCGMFGHAVGSDGWNCADSYKPKLDKYISHNQEMYSLILNH
jgi:hypothetical protein